MLNYIWGGMILISLLVSAFTGRIEATSAAALSGAADGVQMCITLLGIMCLWTGIAHIGSRAGMVKIMAKILTPITSFIFPKIKGDSKAMGSIVMNVTANLLGMGNAATPLGIKAMEELHTINKYSSTASDAMCMFVVLNTASIQLIPTTIISLRQAYGSAEPTSVILPIWLVSIAALTVGITAAKIFERKDRL